MPRRRARHVAACAACATAAAAWIVRSLRQSLLHESLETVPLEAHWLLGAVPTTQQFYAVRKGDAEDPWANLDDVVHASSGSLELRRTRLTKPLRVVSRNPLGMGLAKCSRLVCFGLRVQVPRFPRFVSLTRPAYLAPAPSGSVHIDHPRRPHAPISCLTTRTPGLREFRRHPNPSPAAVLLRFCGTSRRHAPIENVDLGGGRALSTLKALRAHVADGARAQSRQAERGVAEEH